MRVFETLSKREKRQQSGGRADVYQYSTLPDPFRVQVIHIWKAAVGPFFEVDTWYTQPASNRIWHEIHDTMARELGVFQLGTQTLNMNPFAQCGEFMQVASTKDCLDLIEISFCMIDRQVRRLGYDEKKISADDAISELNARFREHAIGYQYAEGQLIKIDSQYVHAEIVQPAISLLQERGFQGAKEEFLRAHEHYRHARNKEAIVEALKAFESTMKAICDARKWTYATGAAAKDLINVVLTNGLMPADLLSQFTALRSVMESGLPTVRNKTSGHGQGAQPVPVPDYVVAYALHLTASNIVFLVEAHKAK